jgi:hypothetical protein
MEAPQVSDFFASIHDTVYAWLAVLNRTKHYHSGAKY